MSGAVGPIETQQNKGAAGGYAALDGGANVPADQLGNADLAGTGATAAAAAQANAETFATTATANARFTYASSYWR